MPGAPRSWWRALGRLALRTSRRLIPGRDLEASLLAERDRLSAELTRRLGELYSLQELAHVLSASLRFESTVAEVARYAMRVLDASGAVVLLAPERGGEFEVVAARGVLATHQYRRIDPESGGLVLEAVGHERAVLRSAGDGSLDLFEGARARTAAAAPLRAHGVTAGAIAVADKLVGDFTADDVRLLSTAATHAAVVLTNARLFELVRSGKEQWEGTFDALPEGISIVDAAGTVRRVNDAMAGLMGRSVAAAVGRNLADSLFGDRSALDDLLAAARAGRRSAPAVRRSEASGRWLRLAVSPLPKPDLEAAAVVVVEDITEQKALESQLIQSEKLAAVGTLVSGVAHELNNPLTSIAGLSELLLERETADERAREHLRVVNDQAERASRIVRDLLSFARKSPVEHVPVDLGEIAIRTVTLMHYELAQAGIEVRTSVAPDLPSVPGNRDELQQVLLNLLTNASYALQRLPEGTPRRLAVSVEHDGGRVRLRVTDSGPGIAPEARAQLFDPFFTTKPPGEGTGLGLFLCYSVAETHGGTLTVESEPGRGATFLLSLPCAAGDPATRDRPAPAPVRRRVLVLEEDAAMRRVAAVYFTHEGHHVDEAADGSEAIALARGSDYDLVLADRRAAAGAEPFLAALARVRPGWLDRTIVTGAASAETAAGRALPKPFSPRELREAAAQVWSAPA